MAHPSTVWSSKGDILLVHGRFEITGDVVNNTESVFQVRVSPVVPKSHDLVPTQDIPGHDFFRPITGAPALDDHAQ